ncbi:MAG TPA: bifunctional serine/threonine-protein kinase/formylglycine-generating enzyme family protein [Kofleriaceae bacterium]|nr:bifunctional serine/threonine-protein kinase/formylglycine-generating enzyme family protein [Kofleriaceae bacterium]
MSSTSSTDPTPPRHDADWQPPDTFDEYVLVRPLGQGAMGQVYVAQDTVLDRLVAIKFVLRFEAASGRARFLNEARAIARLQHRNVVTIHRVGETGGCPYIVSEFIRGETLDRIERPAPSQRVLDIARDLARGLSAAHKSGVLHRDLKPSNAIQAEDGTTKLLDFGLAKLTTDEASSEASAAELVETQVASSVADMATTTSFSGTVPPIERAGDPGTVEGVVLGTPFYLAPERWRGNPAIAASDIYSLGALLYELACGRPPHEARTIPILAARVVSNDPVSVSVRAPQLDPALAAVIDRCLTRDPAQRFESADALLRALDEIAGVSARDRTTPAVEENPYRGLFAFESQHRALFFGRRSEVATILERLRNESFVLVAGDSGVGKSSMCRAGILPAIAEGVLGGPAQWSVATMVPGRKPLIALGEAQTQLVGRSTDPTGWTAGDLTAEGSAGLRGHVLFVDQLEEMITMSSPEDAAMLAEILGRIAAAPRPGLRLLGTVRSDFLTRVAAFTGIRDVISRALFLLPPLTRDGIREAIVGPAKLRQVSFESPEMVDLLVDSASSPASLPLLQFTLAELWEVRDRENAVIPARALEEIGGVAGALARHADAVIARMLPEQRLLARDILTRLVTESETRARRTAAELTDDSRQRVEVLEALVQGRLLAAHEEDGEPVYELVHEALITGWVRLRTWMDDEWAARSRLDRARAAAAEWRRLSRPAELLWSAPQLQEITQAQEESLDAETRAFLTSSRRLIRRRRLRRRLLAVAAAAAVLATYGVIKLVAARDTDRAIATRLSRSVKLLDQARKANRETELLQQRAFAAFDGGDDTEGERWWRDARAQARQTEHHYIQAISLLDESLTLDARRRELRSLLADALYERTLIAERDHRPEQLEELLARLDAADPEGSRQARLQRPADLVVAADPAGSEITVERYGRDAAGRRTRQIVHGAQPAPLHARLERGSYLLTLEAPGRAQVRFPVLLERGESMKLEIRLPERREIPAGFLYVPAGRFLYGTSADDDLRRLFMTAAPLHRRETAAFLIAQHETTFAEWIAFLEALPAGERDRRMPRPGNWGMVKLERHGPGAYRLSMTPSKTLLTAFSGEDITYAAREHLREQDWLKFPVSGISAADAIAYTRWLDRSGKVPGARLCTELEWERAARGADDRRFPHGESLQPDEANYLETYPAGGAGPDQVGAHPASASPFGVHDMVGNVFELTTGGASSDVVVARGGAFQFRALTGAAYNRTLVEEGFLGLFVGFRVCATPGGARR